MHKNKTKTIMKLILLVLLLSIFMPSASAAESTSVPSKIVDFIGGFLEMYSPTSWQKDASGTEVPVYNENYNTQRKLFDFLIFTIIFISLSMIAFGKFFKGTKGNAPKALAIVLGISLSVALTTGTRYGSVTIFFPFAKNLIFILLFFMFYAMLKSDTLLGKDNKLWAAILALAITWFSVTVQGVILDDGMTIPERTQAYVPAAGGYSGTYGVASRLGESSGFAYWSSEKAKRVEPPSKSDWSTIPAPSGKKIVSAPVTTVKHTGSAGQACVKGSGIYDCKGGLSCYTQKDAGYAILGDADSLIIIFRKISSEFGNYAKTNWNPVFETYLGVCLEKTSEISKGGVCFRDDQCEGAADNSCNWNMKFYISGQNFAGTCREKQDPGGYCYDENDCWVNNCLRDTYEDMTTWKCAEEKSKVSEEGKCNLDTDCVCGPSKKDGQCLYGNKKYFNDNPLVCPNICNGQTIICDSGSCIRDEIVDPTELNFAEKKMLEDIQDKVCGGTDLCKGLSLE
ncbi:hypothetical protein ACFL0W_04715 [Nanoarchaeota archaeon]